MLFTNGVLNVTILKQILCFPLNCKDEEIDFMKVFFIDLNNLNLLKISFLWLFKNLTRLNLSNNLIAKIENLDDLYHLQELDLSFNKIHMIENLTHLSYLCNLSLYNNKIKIVENIDGLKNLKVLNIGSNEIKDKNFPLYLHNFKKLRSLNISNNPYSRNNKANDHILTFIPQLLYLNNKKISSHEKYLAHERFCKKIGKLKKLSSKYGNKKLEILEVNENRIYENNTNISVLHKRIFNDFKIFSELSSNDYFQHLLEKLTKKLHDFSSILLETLLQGRDKRMKILRKYVNIYKDMRQENVETKRYRISHCKYYQNITNTELVLQNISNFEKELFDLRLKLLADECNLQYRFENLLNDLEKDIKIELYELMKPVGNIFKNVKHELNLYCSAVLKNFKNNPENLCFNEKNNFTFTNLNEFTHKFKILSLCRICEFQFEITNNIYDWKNDSYFKIFIDNTMQNHRKGVLEIVNALESLRKLNK